MKSFGIKRDGRDPRWEKFIDWCNKRNGQCWDGHSLSFHYGLRSNGEWDCTDARYFDHIITLDEWEAVFMQPELAGREYDESLLRDWLNSPGVCLSGAEIMPNGLTKGFNEFLDKRYAKEDRKAVIKAEIERLNKELKELEGCNN